jgi:colanic acid/amylovoran biosynthesis glycosyltransferase
LNIAYLVNKYPAVSHSFIRREIAGIEGAGGTVSRFSVRHSDPELLPEIWDKREYEKTEAILENSWFDLVLQMFLKGLASPMQFADAMRIAFTGSSFRPSDIVRRIAYIAEAAWLTRQLKDQDVKHLHAHFGTNSATVARLAYKLGGPPYSFTVHGPDEFDRPIELDLRGKISDALFAVAISNFGKGQLMRWANYRDWGKIEVIRCGVDDNFIRNDRLKPTYEKTQFASIARLSRQKGIPLLIQAAAILKDGGYRFTIQLVGGGEMQQQVENMIRDYDLQDHVNLVGWASSMEIVECLLDSKAMVLPSFAEGLPVVIMEALALEVPVIVTAIAGTPELVNDQCGWLIPSGSVDALAEALKTAMQTPPQTLAKMGKAGRERVVSLHDSMKNGAELFKLFVKYHEHD